jgi:hypothetical protein
MTRQADSITRRSAVVRLGGLLIVGVFRPADWRRYSVHEPLEHPDPRPGITAANVLKEDDLPKKRSVREAYEAARTYPELFDGVCCPCDCKDSMNHRSLLSCFESRQATGCMGCQEPGELVGRLAKEGKTLAEIRQSIDKKYG